MKKLIIGTLLFIGAAGFAADSTTNMQSEWKAVAVTPYVALAQGGYAMSGLKASAIADNGWVVELDGAMRENAPGNTNQDWQLFVGAKKDVWSYQNLDVSVGGGFGHVHTERVHDYSNGFLGNWGEASDLTGRLTLSHSYKINSKGDAVRLDLNTQFRSGQTETNILLGYSISFGLDNKNVPKAESVTQTLSQPITVSQAEQK